MTATAQPHTAGPVDRCPLEVAADKADKAIALVRAGHRQRAMAAIVEGRARLRRAGLADSPSSQEVRRRLCAAEAAVDGLEVDCDYVICDGTGRRWRPVTDTDVITGGQVFVPDHLVERFAPEQSDDDNEAQGEDYDIGPRGVMPVNGKAPDSYGDVCVEGLYGTYWFPFVGCYLPE